MKKLFYHLSVVTLICIGSLQVFGSPAERIPARREGGVTAPLLGDEIDLETMDGVDQLTKLVLLKTDSLPGESDKLDARYLMALMETLYTGLRKPFKSVSADILGIFPTLEFLNISCEINSQGTSNRRAPKTNLDVKRRSLDEPLNSSNGPSLQDSDSNYANDSTLLSDLYLTSGINNGASTNYKSSIQVCKAVTNDCLSMNDLIQILPPSITSANSLLVRLCPVILFRLMSNICRHDTELMPPEYEHTKTGEVRAEEPPSDSQLSNSNSQIASTDKAISLNTLQILKNLRNQNSDEVAGNKRPQKLHKKLKTAQTNYKNQGHITTGGLKQHKVDEQLLKIRLKLSEPSIEKVWIFSLLFVILSIVVSMGGLIVLPFVKKTTRRRILTLFEGLAVGGLTGSATLHMFPQAFGLVDENYHRYFWRIFVVFLGIYLCYLCERTIKILKVVRAKMRRRSRASLIDMDFRYGFQSLSDQQHHSSWSQHHREHVSQISGRIVPDLSGGSGIAHGSDYVKDAPPDRGTSRVKSMWETTNRKPRPETPESFELSPPSKYLVRMGLKETPRGGERSYQQEDERGAKRRSKEKRQKRKKDKPDDELTRNANQLSADESLRLDESMDPTRKRLIRCLKSVRSQFSPVYVVFNQPQNEQELRSHSKKQQATNREHRKHHQAAAGAKSNLWTQQRPRRNRLLENLQPLQERIRAGDGALTRSSTKRQAKLEEMETMLYHQNLIEQQRNARGANLDAHYQQHRLSDVNDLAGERQDQDNPVRMSVDTVSWMILFGDGLLNVIDGLSIGAAFERNILAGISISVAVMLEEVTHRLGTTAILIRTGFSIKQSFICTFLSACALFPGMIVGIMLSDATDEATPYIFCAAGGIFLYTGLVDVMKEMNRSIENAMRKDIKTTLKIFALQNIGIVLAVVFLSFLALYEPDFEEYQKILNSN